MVLLGLDLSLNCSGWTVARAELGGLVQATEAGVIVTDAKHPLESRLDAVASDLETLYALHGFEHAVAERFIPIVGRGRTVEHPDGTVETTRGTTSDTLFRLACVHGTALLTLRRQGLPLPALSYINRSHAAKVVVGDGRAGKAEVRAFMERTFPDLAWPKAIAKREGVADALLVLLCHARETLGAFPASSVEGRPVL